jgi:hypothetical protein
MPTAHRPDGRWPSRTCVANRPTLADPSIDPVRLAHTSPKSTFTSAVSPPRTSAPTSMYKKSALLISTTSLVRARQHRTNQSVSEPRGYVVSISQTRRAERPAPTGRCGRDRGQTPGPPRVRASSVLSRLARSLRTDAGWLRPQRRNPRDHRIRPLSRRRPSVQRAVKPPSLCKPSA